MPVSDVIQLLKQAFPDMTDEDVSTLAETAVPRFFEAGAVITQEGEPGSTLYVIGEGDVDVWVRADDELEILVDTISAVTYFGEMAFLGGTTRMATTRARTDCHMVAIEEMDFLPVTLKNPSLLHALLRQVIGHLRQNDAAVIQELNVKNEALKKTYADLSEQEQLRTQFITTLSHEMRTPLTSIKGFLGLINQGAIQGDSLRVAMESITRNVERMVGLTNDLLILYEMHPAESKCVYLNLADVLIQALNAAQEAMDGETTAVTLDIAPDLPEINADRRGVTLAIRALIENAFKFNPDKKPVSIRAYCPDAETLAIAVQDQGIGIPKKSQGKIFEPFVRLEKEGGQLLFPGLGVGLTIAKFVVERHNGRLLIESEPGVGSTFTICLSQNQDQEDTLPED